MALATSTFAVHAVAVFGYCVMTTHAHFLVRCGEGGLSRPMQELFGGYSRWWGRRHGKRGHLFQNRCYVADVESDAHLMVAAAYIDLNPVRAGVVDRPESWPWSSYRAHVGLERPHPLLANDEFLRMFGHATEVAHDGYRRFVRSWQQNGGRRPGA